jgi:hypothetical protein
MNIMRFHVILPPSFYIFAVCVRTYHKLISDDLALVQFLDRRDICSAYGVYFIIIRVF